MGAFVYMLSCADGSYYTGCATGEELTKRIAESIRQLKRDDFTPIHPAPRFALGRQAGRAILPREVERSETQRGRGTARSAVEGAWKKSAK